MNYWSILTAARANRILLSGCCCNLIEIGPFHSLCSMIAPLYNLFTSIYIYLPLKFQFPKKIVLSPSTKPEHSNPPVLYLHVVVVLVIVCLSIEDWIVIDSYYLSFHSIVNSRYSFISMSTMLVIYWYQHDPFVFYYH